MHWQSGRWMDGLTAKDLCAHQQGQVAKLYYSMRVEELVTFLEHNTHNGFPVLFFENGKRKLQGTVLRSQLYSLLEHKRFKATCDTPSRKSFRQEEFEALQVPSR